MQNPGKASLCVAGTLWLLQLPSRGATVCVHVRVRDLLGYGAADHFCGAEGFFL